MYSFVEDTGVPLNMFAFGGGGVRRSVEMEERMDLERSFVSL